VGDDLCEREGRGFHVVAALDDFEVGRYGAQVFVGVLVREVSQAEGLADLAWCEELFELRAGQSASAWCLLERRMSPWRECRARGLGCVGPL
jgi:hypothetical protein